MTEAVTHYKGKVKYYDVVNEAICGCITWPGSSFSTCEDYVASEEGAEKCGYSERYNTYLKKTVFWPDVDDFIGVHSYWHKIWFWRSSFNNRQKNSGYLIVQGF